MENVA